MVKEHIETSASPTPKGAYSQGLRVGDFVFVAGQGPRNPAVADVPQGIEAQTRQALANVRHILEAAGASMDDVVKATVHLSDLADFAAFDAVYREFFSPPYPVRTTVRSGLPGIRVEIDVIAIGSRGAPEPRLEGAGS